MYNLVWQSVMCRPGKCMILLMMKNQMLRPTAPTARRRLSTWGKRAAAYPHPNTGAGMGSAQTITLIGLKPGIKTIAAVHSQCR
jgi:hypothetical protein